MRLINDGRWCCLLWFVDKNGWMVVHTESSHHHEEGFKGTGFLQRPAIS